MKYRGREAQLDSLCLGKSWLRLNPFAVAGSTSAAIATFSVEKIKTSLLTVFFSPVIYSHIRT